MKNKTRIFAALALSASLALGGCTQASRVSNNISTEANNFNVTRRIVVINTITDTPLLEIVGNFSIKVDGAGQKLDVTVKEGDGTFKKHFVGLDAATVVYTVEDLSGADVSSARYQISYLPEAILPITLKDGTN